MTEEVDEEDNEDRISFGDPDIISQTTKCLVMSWVPKADTF